MLHTVDIPHPENKYLKTYPCLAIEIAPMIKISVFLL